MATLATVTAIFAGVTAVMNAASAYHQYRTNHPRRKRTGEVSNYTVAHNGLSMCSHNVHRHQTLRTASCTGESSQQLAQLAPNSNYQLCRSVSESPAQILDRSRFREIIHLMPKQTAPNTFTDDHYGLSTGAVPRGHTRSAKAQARNEARNEAEAHWVSFQCREYGRDGHAHARAVAVVDYTKSRVTMYVESDKIYYRNYEVHSCNVAAFADKYRRNQVFSGVLEGKKLTKSNGQVTIVEDDGVCLFRSSNCWTRLGLPADGLSRQQLAEDPMFVEMVRGAVFGLISCLYENPHCMNVDMSYGNGVDFVHVDTNEDKPDYGSDCRFSVFSFGNDNDKWAREMVLIG